MPPTFDAHNARPSGGLCALAFHALPALLMAALVVSAAPRRPLATFTISEQFGVSHPLQVIDFDFSGSFDPRGAYMIGPEGNPVAFQRLSGGKIAVETDLPARARRSWQLFAGTPPRAIAGEVRISNGAGFIEVVNGKTGVRVPKLDAAHSNLAPIQGVRLAGGVWAATGPNYLSEPVDKINPPRLEARTAETRVIESGPLLARIEVDYSYDRPALAYGGRTLIPAGRGYYRSTITLEADSPSILIED
ncbi:MAG TPA: hypothetical protein VG345_13680, partial [Bryobacteraceae bacterium]|nr:hypothetical protein [Bryobacteraceae bacterium]